MSWRSFQIPFWRFSFSTSGFQYLCGLSEPFSILWTQDQPLVDSRDEISSFCRFRARSFQLRHVPLDLRS
ncbi:unnamed protein product [Spirodela intermedia]|uniref:Uncharacterized protein n=1 Tax=Spirodela intermedia TaxID=51605 RepID=A0A7I8JK81_SPIIN|nr:unnamed protein product [Spirodela intermedia]CAA6670003.1 unnamed protein product [Spirodela intermedia]